MAARAAVNFFPCFFMLTPVVQTGSSSPPTCSLPDDVETHGTRGPTDGLHGRVERLGVEVRHLQLRDVLDLLRRDGADLVLVRLRGSLRDVGGAFQQDGRRRRLRDEAVRTIRIDGDDDRDDQPFVLRGLRVEVLAEIHYVDALRTERGAGGPARGG